MSKANSVLHAFRNDDCGMVSAIGIILIVTIISLGMIVGLTTYRDQVIQELGDLAVSLESVDQSYSVVVHGTTSHFEDTESLEDEAGDAPACISLAVDASPE
ncbi:MAG: hypothetical protein CMJ48_12295 [Planctomycetaceae bacterium]|nr:hypothetical protein [Planctomycetaceae bacterium]